MYLVFIELIISLQNTKTAPLMWFPHLDPQWGVHQLLRSAPTFEKGRLPFHHISCDLSVGVLNFFHSSFILQLFVGSRVAVLMSILAPCVLAPTMNTPWMLFCKNRNHYKFIIRVIGMSFYLISGLLARAVTLDKLLLEIHD